MIGLVTGAWFALLLVKRRHRDFTPELSKQFLSVLYLMALPLAAGFFVFRISFGSEEFSILSTVRSFVLELIVYRSEWLFAGILLGLVVIFAVFLHGIKRVLQEKDYDTTRDGAWGESIR